MSWSSRSAHSGCDEGARFGRYHVPMRTILNAMISTMPTLRRSAALTLLAGVTLGAWAGPAAAAERSASPPVPPVPAALPQGAASVPAGAQVALQQGLFGVRWRIQEMLGAPLGPAAGGQRAPHLVFDASHQRLSGSGGCNRLMGNFTLDGQRLGFKRVVTTMMACPQGMEQERRLIETLSEVQRWHLEEGTLMLMNWQQQVLVKLVKE